MSDAFYRLWLDETLTYSVEIWDDEASLMAHARAPHMAAYRDAMQELGALVSREVVRYDVGEATPL